MKISRNWLSDFVSLEGIDDDTLGERITLCTAEIEGVESGAAALKDLVVGHVLSCEKHREADRLNICIVDTGSKEPTQVICGAPNVAAGQKIVFAPLKAVLPGNFKIEKRKIRGVLSQGMICAEDEIGMGTHHAGIMVLPQDAEIGKSFVTYLTENAEHPDFAQYPVLDTLLEIDNKSLTNRPDLWGMYGMSREIAAIYDRPLAPLTTFQARQQASNSGPEVTVSIADALLQQNLCRRYMGIVIEDITIAPSPKWLCDRLIAVGLRPINNVVDLSNYTMLETGQPFHAFDLRDIKNNTIGVRYANEGEAITTLDGKTHTLTTDMQVIADGSRSVAIAGVMGAENSEVKNDTRTLLLEIANFNAANIRRTSTKLGLRSDSSERFEKSLDPQLVEIAANRFCQLLLQLIPDAKIGRCYDVGLPPAAPINLKLEPRTLNRKLGTSLSDDTMTSILKRLSFKISGNAPAFDVEVPSFRATKDITRDTDLIEEVGRIHGYDKIIPEPPKQALDIPQTNSTYEQMRHTKNILSLELGYTEVESYAFTSTDVITKAGLEVVDHLELLNPIAANAPYLIRDLIPGLLESAVRNLRYNNAFKIYEWGKVFIGKMTEASSCSGIVVSDNTQAFFEVREDVETVLTRLGIAGLRIVEAQENIPNYAHPLRTAVIECQKKPLAIVGALHPVIAKRFDLHTEVIFFTLNGDILEKAPLKRSAYTQLSKYPTVSFDVAVLADPSARIQQLVRIIKDAAPKLIKDITLFDEYEGANIPIGKKSLAFKIVFGSMTETLATKEVHKTQEAIIARLAKSGFPLRSV